MLLCCSSVSHLQFVLSYKDKAGKSNVSFFGMQVHNGLCIEEIIFLKKNLNEKLCLMANI